MTCIFDYGKRFRQNLTASPAAVYLLAHHVTKRVFFCSLLHKLAQRKVFISQDDYDVSSVNQTMINKIAMESVCLSKFVISTRQKC